MTRKPSVRAALLSAPLLGLLLTGCDTVGGWFGKSDAPPLPGERIPVLVRESRVEADPGLASMPVVLPPAVANDTWSQVGGTPDHAPGHLALAAAPAEAWRGDVGRGSGGARMLMTPPVVAGGRIYAMDAESNVSALDAQTGRSLWQVGTRPERERGDATGGGVAAADGRVFAATGFGEVLALNAGDGTVLWRSRVSGPVRGAPSMAGGRVYVVTVDNQLSVLSAENGDALWTHAGLLETAGLLGSSSAAVTSNLVVAPFSSGELFGLRPENGRIAWQENLAAIRRSGALSGLADIRGLPVVDRGLVFAISHSGRMVAVDERIGARVWEQEIGGVETPWVAGDFVYVVNNDAEVVALVRQTGRAKWVVSLDRYEDARRREGRITWAGPVLAGGRLWLAGSNRQLLALSPEDGSVQARYTLPGAAYLPPVVANNTLYVLTDGGTLVAYR
ncbi:PQQ-binding-like beta-propeller repeat protein [Azospirillum halopraeferens]|uniref:outer membrane protein assembly factor BamB family protein n=1 Tax=Azospirillum halopraeferens TaxID=34010 RepID=UPI00049137AF|nr:PQQ-binding-like beta-propeller repeat protein [Azospirillum halopraeferens]